MTLGQALSRAGKILGASNIEDSPLESELLLRHALKIDRVQLYLELDRQLSPDQSEQFWQLIQRRLNREPAAYIVGHREFYGLDFYVDSNVLIPRPETELLVEKALELAKSRPISTIADIGTGCGAIAISLALKLPPAEPCLPRPGGQAWRAGPRIKIYATDISTAALKVASANSRKHGVADRVCLLEGDLLSPLPEPVDLLVANLPYVREADLAKVNTRGFEPELALNGGSDGLDTIRRLCSQVTEKLRPACPEQSRRGGCLLLEIGQGQGQAVTALLRGLFPSASIETFTDLAGVGRVVRLTLQS